MAAAHADRRRRWPARATGKPASVARVARRLSMRPPVIEDFWKRLSSTTQARIALGRAGASLPTQEVLNFSLAHARARDAVHTPFDHDKIAAEITELGF